MQKLAIGNGSGAGSNTVALIPVGSGANIKGATNTFGGVTNFVVVRVDHINGAANDNAYLFVNPSLATEPSTNSAGAISTNTFDYSFDRGRVFAGGQNGATQPYVEMILDEYRVGETFADVAPISGNAPPPVVGPLQFTNVFLSGSNLVLSGKGGSNNAAYFVLATTNITTPLTNWQPVATNSFNASGNFIVTNPGSVGLPQQFFRLLSGNLPSAPLIPPTITTQPTNQTVNAGQTVLLAAAATGSAPLSYQWWFNSTQISGAISPTLSLVNVQAANTGGYSVVVTNSAGSVTSVVATLTVNAPPSITAQPTNLTVTVSNNATFVVAASGSPTIRYQWMFNTNTVLPNATNSSYTIASTITNHAGTYSVIVTNNFGTTNSAFATLTVNPSNAAPDFSMIGFATLSGFASNGTFQAGGTTGGNAGPIVIVTNVTWLVNYAEKSNMALRILIVSNIDCSSLANHHGGFPAGYPTGEILVSSNKTIYSTNGATISRGTLRIGKAADGKDNIIIRNLKFRDLWVFDPSGNYDSYGWDYIGLEGGSHHVWVDHCDFEQVYDGMVDATHASDYVTISWNVFRTQKKCSLIGHSDSNVAEDTSHLNVTFHHNYYVDVDERMPRMRFGNAHVFNLYCENLGGNGIQSTADAATLVDNSYFYQPRSGTLPTREENGGPTGIIKVINSTIVNLPAVNVQFRQLGETNFLFNAPFVGATPPYPYTMDATANVPNIVTNWSGVNKVTSLP